VRISPSRNTFVAGPSASGKSTAVSGIVEQLANRDTSSAHRSEGDYEALRSAQLRHREEKPDIK